MKFVIRATNGFDLDTYPQCKDAYLETVVAPTWAQGTTWSRWAINIETIEDLIKLTNILGTSLIISSIADHNAKDDMTPGIEVYDGYRE